MLAAGRGYIAHFMSHMLPALRRALCDLSPEVREPAAEGCISIFSLFFFFPFPFSFF